MSIRRTFVLAAMMVALLVPMASPELLADDLGQSFDRIPDANGSSAELSPAISPNGAQVVRPVVVPNAAPGELPAVPAPAQPDWQTYYSRGWVEVMRTHEYDAAVNDLSEAIEMKGTAPLIYAVRSLAYANLGKIPETQADMDQALKTAMPKVLMAVNFMGMRASLVLGDRDKALGYLKAAKASPPKQAITLNRLAWLLATSPDDALRDGKTAISLATEACKLTNWKVPAYIDTLAAAYAETGDFDNAVKTEDQCLQLNFTNETAKQNCEGHMALFQSHQPYRQPADNAAQ